MDPNSLKIYKNEISAKRERLADLRRQREARQKEFTAGRASIGDAKELASPSPTRPDNRKEELESLISSLVGDGTRSSTPGSKNANDRSSTGEGLAERGRSSNVPHDPSDNESDVPDGSRSNPSRIATPQQAQSLSFAPLTVLTGAPAITKTEYITFNKGVQTGERSWGYGDRGSDSSGSESDYQSFGIQNGQRRGRKRLSRKAREKEEEELKEKIRRLEEEIEAKEAALHTALKHESDNQDKITAKILSDEESQAFMSLEQFQGFVGRASKVVERALDEEYDILADYAARGFSLDEMDEDGFGTVKGRAGRGIKELIQFYDERWSRKRMISDVNFSPKFPELVLASYTKNPTAPNDPDGLVQVWNLHMHSRPEYIFHAQSDILTAMFSPYHPNLIIGGAYSGQVLLWDTRAQSAPVQKTPLTGYGHTHPIYSLDIVGTPNANNIVSCSTDGVVCTWTVDMLTQPQEYLELVTPPPAKTDEMAPTCMAFPAEDPTYFLAGTEEGVIYPCHRYDRAGARSGVDTRLSYRGHTAPVMSLSFHPAHGPLNLTDLVLSSGLDWSVKLWKVRTPTGTGGTSGSASLNHLSSTGSLSSSGAVATPLADWPRDAPVYCTRWSPARPGVFALVDGAGTLEIWDLASDPEEPVVRTQPSNAAKMRLGLAATSGGAGTTTSTSNTGAANGTASAAKTPTPTPGGAGSVPNTFEAPPSFPSSIPSSSIPSAPSNLNPNPNLDPASFSTPFALPRSLNKVAWQPGQGRRLAVGGLEGVLSVFEVGSRLCGAREVDGEDGDADAGAGSVEWDVVKRWVGRLEVG